MLIKNFPYNHHSETVALFLTHQWLCFTTMKKSTNWYSLDCIYNDKHVTDLIWSGLLALCSLMDDVSIIRIHTSVASISGVTHPSPHSVPPPASLSRLWIPHTNPLFNPVKEVTHVTALYSLMHFNSINICFCLFSGNKHSSHLKKAA